MKLLLKKIFIFIIFIFSLFFIIYLIFLNKLINKKLKFNTNKYSPEIYSDIVRFNVNDKINKNKFIEILYLFKYRKSKFVNKSGDFSVKNNIITLIRRSFYIYNTYNNVSYLKLTFEKNKLISILDINKNIYVNNIILDPQIIYFSNYSNKYKHYKKIDSFCNTLINTIILIEDKNYFYHKGFNIFSIIRAIIKNLKTKKIKQGGSTITQQLVKNIFFNNKKNLFRKFNELIISIIIELKFSKNRILEMYINEIFFGVFNGKEIRGFPLASLFYFNRPIEELNLNQQVILVSMIKGASMYNPYKNFNLLINRRNFILQKMKFNKIINKNIYNNLIKKNIFLNKNNNIIENCSFIKIIKNDIYNYNNSYKNCKKIFSTLDLISQKYADLSTNKVLFKLKHLYNIKDLEISMLVVNHKNGKIKASIGGFNNSYYGFNRIYINRNIGSIIKPIIYLYALKSKNYQLNTLLLDKPIHNNNFTKWHPKNYNKKYFGPIILLDSLKNSLNSSTINLGLKLGINNIINFIKLLTMNNNLNINKFPSILLGALNLNLIEIAQMYQPIVNNGKIIKLYSFNGLINKNNTFIKKKNYKNKIFSSKFSYLIKFCMKKIIEEGTAKNIKINKNLSVAGKTGTTNKCIDNWFVGFDNNEICVIWIGKDNNNPTKIFSSDGSAKVYEYYINNNILSESIKDIKPNNIHYFNIDIYGKIMCNNHISRKIPIYSKNPKILMNKCLHHNFMIIYFNKLFNFFIN